MALIALVSTIMVIATEITTVEIVAQIPITMARVVGITIENKAGVIAVAIISPADIIIRGIEAMIQVVFGAVWS
jgi:hypothetical protein